jgi:hypothetical protein
VLSGALTTENVATAQRLGVSRILQKPQDFRTLERALAQLVEEFGLLQGELIAA